MNHYSPQKNCMQSQDFQVQAQRSNPQEGKSVQFGMHPLLASQLNLHFCWCLLRSFLSSEQDIFPLERHPAFVNATVSQWNKCCRSNLSLIFQLRQNRIWHMLRRRHGHALSLVPQESKNWEFWWLLRELAQHQGLFPFFLPVPTPAVNSLGSGQQAGRGHSLADDLN